MLFGRREARDNARNNTETRDTWRLIGALKEGLKTDADAHVGPAGGNVSLQRLGIALVADGLHGWAKGADAGKEELVGLVEIVGRSDPFELEAELVDRVGETAHIAGTVVEEVEHVGSRGSTTTPPQLIDTCVE